MGPTVADAPAPVKFEWPRNDEHTAIVGRNGSGKTQLGAHVLSVRDYEKENWTIIDYKREQLFADLRNVRKIGFKDWPDEPGLYILHSAPHLENETEDWLWGRWERGKGGIYADEGYMLPQIQGGAFQGILTQGRSLRIPVITLTQRPVRVSPFAFSEASHIAVFDLNRRKDWQTIEENTAEGFADWLPAEFEQGLPPYHARWFAVKKKASFVLKPVPSAKEIVAKLDDKLAAKHKRRWF